MFNFVQFQGSGYLDFQLPVRADDGSIQATIYSSNGSILSSSVQFTSGTVDTTSDAEYEAGSSLIVLNSTSSIQKGKRYLFGGPEELQGEFVTVKRLGPADNAVTLMRPTINFHEVSSSFESTDVRVLVSGSSTNQVSTNNYCKLAFEYQAEAQPEFHKSFSVTRFIPVTNLSIEDLRDFDAQMGKKGLAGTNFSRLQEKAWEMILARVGARGNMGGIVGTVDLTTPHSYLVRRLILENDPANKEQADAMSQRFNEEFEAVFTVAAHDKDGDGAINPNERLRTTIRIIRT